MFAPVYFAFTIFLICSQVLATDEKLSQPSNDEEQRVQGLLLNILTAGLQESRYAVFERTIKDYHKDCFDNVYKNITESDKSNKQHKLEQLETLYAKHIKDYPKQNRQAILDGQIPEPISRNAGIATNALCNQMYGFTL